MTRLSWVVMLAAILMVACSPSPSTTSETGTSSVTAAPATPPPGSSDAAPAAVPGDVDRLLASIGDGFATVTYSRPACKPILDPVCVAQNNTNAERRNGCIRDCELSCRLEDPDVRSGCVHQCQNECTFANPIEDCDMVSTVAQCTSCSDGFAKEAKICTVDIGNGESLEVKTPCESDRFGDNCTACFNQSQGRPVTTEAGVRVALPDSFWVGEINCRCPPPWSGEWTLQCTAPAPSSSVRTDPL